MNGKEALNKLYENLQCEGCHIDCFVKDEEIQECYKWYETIEKDLDRLEKLEKAIEILKRFEIDLKDYCDGHYSLEILYDTGGLTKEQYELLKEILGND